MKDLLTTPDEKRDRDWEKRFLEAFLAGSVLVKDSRPVNGPDGFPYLLVETSDGKESGGRVIDWLAERGIGLVINPGRQPHPDLVLSYGMLWGLRRFGSIWDLPLRFTEGFQAGEPSEEILPAGARKIIKQFLNDQGILQPRFLAVANGQGVEICFSLEALGNPPAAEHEGIAEALSWFFPPAYSVALAGEAGLRKFVPV